MNNVANPVIIDQNYCPNSQCSNQVIINITNIYRNFDVKKKVKLLISNSWVRFFVLFSVPSKVKINNVSFKKISGTSSTKEAVNLICSKSVPCQQVVLSDIDLEYKGGGGSAASTCTNVQPAVSGKLNPPACTNKH